MKIAFALYVALTWVALNQDRGYDDLNRQILDLHKTYKTEEACANACAALEREGLIPRGLVQGRAMDYFCIEVPGE